MKIYHWLQKHFNRLLFFPLLLTSNSNFLLTFPISYNFFSLFSFYCLFYLCLPSLFSNNTLHTFYNFFCFMYTLIFSHQYKIKKFISLYSVIHLFPWSGILDENYELSETFQVPDIKTGKMVRLMSQLTSKEEEMFRNMIRRLNNIVSV